MRPGLKLATVCAVAAAGTALAVPAATAAPAPHPFGAPAGNTAEATTATTQADATVRTTLSQGDTLTKGQSLYSAGLGTVLTMQDDGNLVEYATTTGQPLFASNTAGTGDHVVFQTDGNVVVVTATGAPVWATGTYAPNTSPADRFGPAGNGQILALSDNKVVFFAGQPLTAFPGFVIGELVSANQQYAAIMQSDGNFVVYAATSPTSAHPIWASGTAGHPRSILAAQSDGNIVIYTSGRPIWASGSNGHAAAYFLVMQDDGNLVEYTGNGTPVWATGTAGRH